MVKKHIYNTINMALYLKFDYGNGHEKDCSLSYCEVVEGEFTETGWKVVTRWVWLIIHGVIWVAGTCLRCMHVCILYILTQLCSVGYSFLCLSSIAYRQNHI